MPALTSLIRLISSVVKAQNSKRLQVQRYKIKPNVARHLHLLQNLVRMLDMRNPLFIVRYLNMQLVWLDLLWYTHTFK